MSGEVPFAVAELIEIRDGIQAPRVLGRGAKVGVTELHLQAGQVLALAYRGDGESVAQAVRVDRLLDVCLLAVAAQRAADLRLIEPPERLKPEPTARRPS